MRWRSCQVALLTLLGGTAAACGQASQPAERPKLSWPDSDRRLNFEMWFDVAEFRAFTPYTADVIVPSVVWNAVAEPTRAGEQALRRYITIARGRRPEFRIGRRIAASTTRVAAATYPRGRIPRALVPDDAILPDHWPGAPERPYIDIRRADVRARLVQYAVEDTQGKADFIALDSLLLQFGGFPKGVAAREWYEANYALIEEFGRATANAGLGIIINPTGRPEATWSRAALHCDGFVLEMPVVRRVRCKPPMVEAELATYRRVLDAGKFVGLVPNVHGNPDDAARAAEVRLVAGAAMLVREPGDALFVAPMQRRPAPTDWMEWPGRFGQALGRYRREGNVYTREFERVTLVVDFEQERVDVRPK